MFIFWGTKRTERKQGLVADFCPIDRGIRAFRLLRIGLASHIYFLSFGQGKLVGHVIECTDCGLRLSTDPLKYAMFAAESKESPVGLTELERLTFPQVREVHGARLTQEAQIQRTAHVLNPAERLQAMLEPFALLNPGVETRYATSSTLDKQSGLGCMGTLVMTLVLLVIAINLPEPRSSQFLGATVFVGGLGALYTFVQLGLGPGRFVRQKIVPTLARALDPLEPTQTELQACLDKCKTAGMKIGKKVKLATLWSELEHRTTRLVAG